MMTLSVILGATQEVVVIAYPSVQSLDSMIHDSEALRSTSWVEIGDVRPQRFELTVLKRQKETGLA